MSVQHLRNDVDELERWRHEEVDPQLREVRRIVPVVDELALARAIRRELLKGWRGLVAIAATAGMVATSVHSWWH